MADNGLFSTRGAFAVVRFWHPIGVDVHDMILLVDDDLALRHSMATLLQGEGYSVETAGDGLAALNLLRGGA